MAKRILGYAILVAVVSFSFALTAFKIGILGALLTYALAVILTALIFAAVCLIA